MGFESKLKQVWPAAWFRLKFLKYKYGRKGEPELRLVRHFVRTDGVAVDVGCAVGIYSAELARRVRRVIAFEGNPAVADFARRVAAKNVEVVNVALSAREGSAILRIPLNRKGHTVDDLATIADTRALEGPTVDVEVPTRTLDSFGIAECGLIKIDVEGHEEAVLEGARGLIEAQRPVLMIEFDERFNPGGLARVAQWLATLAYRGYFLSGGRLRPLATFNAAVHQDFAAAEGAKREGRAVEVVNNFIFIPEARRAAVMESLGRAGIAPA